MSEANMCFAGGEPEESILICIETLRQALWPSESFSTLAMTYKDEGDMEKSLKCEVIAAHSNPSDKRMGKVGRNVSGIS